MSFDDKTISLVDRLNDCADLDEAEGATAYVVAMTREAAKELSKLASEKEELTAKVPQLEKRLAEQQALLSRFAEWYGKGSIYGESQDAIIGGMEELTKLLTEAEKLPEGWKLVPVEPITGNNYERGLWSRRNWEAALEDMLSASPKGE